MPDPSRTIDRFFWGFHVNPGQLSARHIFAPGLYESDAAVDEAVRARRELEAGVGAGELVDVHDAVLRLAAVVRVEIAVHEARLAPAELTALAPASSSQFAQPAPQLPTSFR